MIRITLVSYLNTRPFSEGLLSSFRADELELDFRPPATCAEALREDSCDLALVPVGSIPDLGEVEILNRYCIGAEKQVDSVFLLSDVRAEELEAVIPDAHSRTSNRLCRILCERYWKNGAEWKGYETPAGMRLPEGTGQVAIGDLAMKIADQFRYRYDLAKAWREMTGYPFVFAVWAMRPGKLDAEQLARIEDALGKGVSDVAGAAKKWGEAFGFTEEKAEKYFRESISYGFSAEKHEAMELFLSL